MVDMTEGGTFTEIPQRLYLDTQFCFAYHVPEDTQHQAAEVMSEGLKVLSQWELVEVYVSILTIDELAWKLGGVLYDRDHGPGAWRQITGRKKRAAFSRLGDDIASIVEDFLSESWIRPLPIEENAYAMLPSVMRGQDLRPADVCHLALAWAAGCGVVTNDRDFHALQDAPVEVVGY
jgi:predicted nucleic acid-binding protein